jgi:hypothetical protein
MELSNRGLVQILDYSLTRIALVFAVFRVGRRARRTGFCLGTRGGGGRGP